MRSDLGTLSNVTPEETGIVSPRIGFAPFAFLVRIVLFHVINPRLRRSVILEVIREWKKLPVSRQWRQKVLSLLYWDVQEGNRRYPGAGALRRHSRNRCRRSR